MQVYFNDAPFLPYISIKERQAYKVLMEEKEIIFEEKKQQEDAKRLAKQMGSKFR